MTTRRTFMSALMALPLVGTIARATSFSDRRFGVSPCLSERPKQIGIPGKSYFLAGVHTHIHKAFLNGVDVSCYCFEVDVAGGWIGCYEHTYENGKLRLAEPRITKRQRNSMTYVGGKFISHPDYDSELPRYWQFGKIEIR